MTWVNWWNFQLQCHWLQFRPEQTLHVLIAHFISKGSHLQIYHPFSKLPLFFFYIPNLYRNTYRIVALAGVSRYVSYCGKNVSSRPNLAVNFESPMLSSDKQLEQKYILVIDGERQKLRNIHILPGCPPEIQYYILHCGCLGPMGHDPYGSHSTGNGSHHCCFY